MEPFKKRYLCLFSFCLAVYVDSNFESRTDIFQNIEILPEVVLWAILQMEWPHNRRSLLSKSKNSSIFANEWIHRVPGILQLLFLCCKWELESFLIKSMKSCQVGIYELICWGTSGTSQNMLKLEGRKRTKTMSTNALTCRINKLCL